MMMMVECVAAAEEDEGEEMKLGSLSIITTAAANNGFTCAERLS